jgi:AcrR family transcriptional regulator
MAEDPATTGTPVTGAPDWEERSVRRVVAGGRDQLLERSRRIVEAAYELLDEGLEELTIRAVLKKTGLSRRAFYERFSGKDDLLLAVFEHTILLASSHYRLQVAQVDDPLERLRIVVTLIILGRQALDDAGDTSEGRRAAAMSREHLRLAESCPEELQHALQPLLSLLAEELAAGMAQGLVRETDPGRLARLVYNLVSTTVLTELLRSEGEQSDRELLAEDIWEFCRRAIAA